MQKPRINGTSVVGIFPHGAAACGAQDMAGNVWERCSTQFLSYEEIKKTGHVEPETLYTIENETGESRTYVLRGGSWFAAPRFARCACRYSGYPADWLDRTGFVSPVVLLLNAIH